MVNALAIWLNDLQVAVVERARRGRLRLSYTEQAHATFAAGTPVLSLNLPLVERSYSNALARAFLDGLLPEGEPRRAIAADLRLPAHDVFGLLEELGRDCAGALVIQPVGDPPPQAPSTALAEPIDDEELARLLGNLRSAPLGAGGGVRLSLAGAQEKLLLTRMPDGRWGRPVANAPSTHILKPKIAGYMNTVENESPSGTATRTPRTSRCCTPSRARCGWRRCTTCWRPASTLTSTTSSRCTSTRCRRPTA